MQLYMIRHGQSYVNLKDWDGGNQDTALTELGNQQAAALGKWIPGEINKIDALYASTMKRAQETAVYVANAFDIPILNDDRIREIGNNRHDHTPWPSDDLAGLRHILGQRTAVFLHHAQPQKWRIAHALPRTGWQFHGRTAGKAS